MCCVVEPVYHREKTVARSGSWCPRLNSMARLETLLEGSLDVKGDQDAGWVRLGKVLDGLDHFVGSILASHSVLERARRRQN